MTTGKHIGIGVGIIIVNDDTKEPTIYLQQRGPACRDAIGEWELPGGAVEYGETLKEAAIREVKEETGLDIAIIDCVGVADEHHLGHWVSFVFTAKIVGGTMSCREPTKVVAQGFYPLDAMPAPLARISAQDIAEYQKGHRVPITTLRR
jgi:mutator protein MutT